VTRARRVPAGTTVRDALDSALIALTAAGCETPRLDAELLLAEALGLNRGALLTRPELVLAPDQARRFAEHARRRREREPVAYILGRQGFRFVELLVDRRVLVPRPETELLVEVGLELAPGSRVVDVGTGSGAVALALACERPDLQLLGTDSSAAALELARANAAQLAPGVVMLHGDLLEPVDGPVDAVLSNPPYVAEGDPVAPEVSRHEPRAALWAGGDGLDVLRRLPGAARAAGASLLAVEVGAGQAAAVAGLMRAAGAAGVEVRRDLAGIDRVVIARW